MSSEPAGAQHESHRARRLTVFIEYGDRAGRRHIYFEILKRARRAKLAGLTTFQGDLGYGYSGRLHHTHLLVQDSPLSVVIVDLPERVTPSSKRSAISCRRRSWSSLTLTSSNPDTALPPPMNPILLLAVAAGGFVGAPSRFLLDRLVNRRVDSALPGAPSSSTSPVRSCSGSLPGW